MKLYLLMYDQDNGASEDWNIFYMRGIEVYSSMARLEARQAEITAINPAYDFQVVELELDKPVDDAVESPEEE